MEQKRKRSRQSHLEAGTESARVPHLDSEIKAKIGHQLRVFYGEVINQGIPDRFVNILSSLDDRPDEGSGEAEGANEVEGSRG